MKVFRDLEIEVAPALRKDFISSVEMGLPAGWARDKEAESHSAGLGATEHVYIVCEKTDTRMSALVALVPKEGVGFYVSNIVPRQAGQLTHDEYNRILGDFAEQCIAPTANRLGLKVTRTSDVETIEDWVAEDTAKKFRLFSGLANKSTGTSHPSDRDRWYDFIIAVVTHDDPLDASTLARWLVEEDGWAEDVAHEMAIEFEQEVGLLKHYLGK